MFLAKHERLLTRIAIRYCSQSTKCVWGGEATSICERSTQVPIVNSVSFGYNDLETWKNVALGKEEGHIYSRNTNPTVRALEHKIRDLEGAEAAVSFASGMAAISNLLFTFLSPGQRVVSIRDSYGGTSLLFLEFLTRFNIEATLCTTTDFDEIEREIAKGCDVVYLETPTNPTLKIVDIERIAKAAKAQNAKVIVDNTFATPINQNPLSLGADIVLHSATKYLGGHADAMGGLVCGRAEDVKKVYHFREINGAVLDPHAAYLLLRGMKTLGLRIERQNESAMKVAKYLQAHPKIEAVNYPGLTTHMHHNVAARQMRGFGGMLSFAIRGGFDSLAQALPRLKYAHRAANLGAVETIVGPPVTTSHVECTDEERALLGIPEGLVRYSCGIEDVNDLISDLEQALFCVQIMMND